MKKKFLFVNIYSKNPYPSCSLSNFAEHSFCFDGVTFRCMEGLLQSLKAPPELQYQFCLMDGKTAKQAGSRYSWQKNGSVFHWNGSVFSRYSSEYWRFLRRAYDALLQNRDFAQALLDTGHCFLWHSSGKFCRKNTCLTTFEFLTLLYRARRKAQKTALTNRIPVSRLR